MIRNRIALLLVCGMFVGCSDDEPSSGWRVEEGNGDQTEFGQDGDVIVAADGTTYVVTGSPNGDECVDIGDGQCVDLTGATGRYCDDEGAQADIIVDDNGEVIEVICYPPADDGTPIEELTPDADGNVELPQNQSGTVIVFPDDTDEQVLKGNLDLIAERTTIFGNGIDVTKIDGNLTVESNNARVRGLTILGNVDIKKNSNNTKIALCKIHGNLNIQANGASVSSCQVFGNVQVDGNNATLVNIGVQGEWKVESSANCVGCYSFSDENDDFMTTDDELGDALECGQ